MLYSPGAPCTKFVSSSVSVNLNYSVYCNNSFNARTRWREDVCVTSTYWYSISIFNNANWIGFKYLQAKCAPIEVVHSSSVLSSPSMELGRIIIIKFANNKVIECFSLDWLVLVCFIFFLDEVARSRAKFTSNASVLCMETVYSTNTRCLQPGVYASTRL